MIPYYLTCRSDALYILQTISSVERKVSVCVVKSHTDLKDSDPPCHIPRGPFDKVHFRLTRIHVLLKQSLPTRIRLTSLLRSMLICLVRYCSDQINNQSLMIDDRV